MSTATGTILHLEPIRVEDLPMHPDFAEHGFSAEANEQRPSLADFVVSIIQEADAAMDVPSLEWSGPGKTRSSPPSTAQVENGKKVITPEEMSALAWKDSLLPSRRQNPLAEKEEWFGRKSTHEASVAKGTATFAELDDGLRRDHAPQEAGYDATIYDQPLVVDYTAQVAETTFGGDIHAVEVKVYEMCHTMPMPLKPRIFSVCIVAARVGQKKFVVVQLPIDLSAYKKAFYATGRNVSEGENALKKKPVVIGKYVSIERGLDHGDNSIWEMIVASKVGGVMPLMVQNMALPGAIAKDVGHFMEFNEKKRAEATATKTTTTEEDTTATSTEPTPA